MATNRPDLDAIEPDPGPIELENQWDLALGFLVGLVLMPLVICMDVLLIWWLW